MSKTEKQEKFENAVKTILELIGEDPNREGLKDTPKRVFKAYEHICGGYTQDAKEILLKANFETTNTQMVVVKDIELYSLCEHHMLPIIGKVSVAYIPNGKVVGLSKIPRVVEVFARRLQIQEQLTEQIATAIEDAISPKGVAVLVDAKHMCMEMRGVEKVCSSTVTTSFKGEFTKKDVRDEFFEYIR
jgi:GTP cyclohydrolase I